MIQEIQLFFLQKFLGKKKKVRWTDPPFLYDPRRGSKGEDDIDECRVEGDGSKLFSLYSYT